MTELMFSLLDPNTLLPHRAGIAGLALALSHLDPETARLQWSTTETGVQLRWEGRDDEALQWLLRQTYILEDGLLTVPALNLDTNAKFSFSQGLLNSFLQHSKQRTLEKTSRTVNFTIAEDQPQVSETYAPILDCYYLRDLKLCDRKGKLNKTFDVKGQHLPGAIECFANGSLTEPPERFLPLLFLPIACSYHLLPEQRAALVIPEITNLQAWIKRRQQIAAPVQRRWRLSSSGEAGLSFLLEESLFTELQKFQVNYCEVYQLGGQIWDGNQKRLKQAVYPVLAQPLTLSIFRQAVQVFPVRVLAKKDSDEYYARASSVLAWIADNLIRGKPWYLEFMQFRKQQDQIYPDARRGLRSMTETQLSSHEQILFEAVQGAFKNYLRIQGKEAGRQGRQNIDYAQVLKKVIYRLQKPATQQEFASALVQFLSQYPSPQAKGNGLEIYQWLHGDRNRWRQAQDLALLAIVTYQGKSKEDPEVPDLALEAISLDDD
ncbi:type I-MYXAN CRISPR-associated Cas8a1/Cmx1 [Synechococcus elongatus]|uniref:type I-MYXAN CRISPR-associated Cas8a1/Cmx1 n=1 Tax=Synechococcus elongatus TaxID=32046 RepID=UPI000F7E7EDA|nr:type I-MYXAN CRISPR-associated Cas8a1/Cmx1 [Synechococcus elongatus]